MFSATTIESAPPAAFVPATTDQPDEATKIECGLFNRARREGETARERKSRWLLMSPTLVTLCPLPSGPRSFRRASHLFRDPVSLGM
jgi:hypothetical protein